MLWWTTRKMWDTSTGMIKNRNAKVRAVCRPRIAAGSTSVFLTLLLILLLSPLTGHAQSLVVSSGDSAIYQAVIESFRTHLQKLCIAENVRPCPDGLHTVIAGDGPDLEKEAAGKRLVISLGTKAALEANRIQSVVPVLYALIPRSTYDDLTSSGKKNRTAIYLDQPITRQLHLAQIIRQDPKIGVLLGKDSLGFEASLVQHAEQEKTSVLQEVIESPDELGPKLQNLLKRVDLLLTLPDKVVFSKNSAFKILLSSYHNGVPVIGFSSAYVKAGALASVHSSPADIGKQIADFYMDHMMKSVKRLPPPSYPKYFQVSVNRQVARSLDISLPSDDEIMQHLLEVDGR